jgi:hypothetical protein
MISIKHTICNNHGFCTTLNRWFLNMSNFVKSIECYFLYVHKDLKQYTSGKRKPTRQLAPTSYLAAFDVHFGIKQKLQIFLISMTPGLVFASLQKLRDFQY